MSQTKLEYIIFGSENSIDKDIFVVIDELPDTIDECKNTCYAAEAELQPYFKEKVNVNIGTIKDGIVTSVMKGTEDEVNNSIFYTAQFHPENTKEYIDRLLPRDVERKILRSLRIMLSLLSRSEHRKVVKEALRGDVWEKLDVLESLDLTQITDIGKRNMSWADYLKTMSFQLGQTSALIVYEEELYCKNTIANRWVYLKPYLNREVDADLFYLQFSKNLLVGVIREIGMSNIKEY